MSLINKFATTTCSAQVQVYTCTIAYTVCYSPSQIDDGHVQHICKCSTLI